MPIAPEETRITSFPAFLRSLSTLQSASIRRMFSLPVGCVMVEVPILMMMRILAFLLPYLAVWKYSILRRL